MASFGNQFLKQLETGDEIKDYKHASRTFIDGLYRLSPKIGSLFHVFIDLNDSIAGIDQNSQIEIGLMAKSVMLPKFNIQTKTNNAYNRKNITQEKIKYDPVTMSFHDDSANIVRDFWYKYYSHFYRDSDHQLSVYASPSKYERRQSQDWGYNPKSNSVNFIKSIRIYSLHQKQFSSYILINPIITNFAHGQHTQGEWTPLEHSMTIEYEAVQYEYGPVSNETVQGFNVIHYDNEPSPLSGVGGGTTSILGKGGLVESAGDVVQNLADGNFGAASLGVLRTAKNFRNADLKGIASAELLQTARNILRGQNTQSPIFVPTQNSVREGLAKSVNSIPGLVGNRNPANGAVSTNMNTQNNQIVPGTSGTAT